MLKVPSKNGEVEHPAVSGGIETNVQNTGLINPTSRRVSEGNWSRQVCGRCGLYALDVTESKRVHTIGGCRQQVKEKTMLVLVIGL